MTRAQLVHRFASRMLATSIFAAILVSSVSIAAAQGLGELSRELDQLEPQVSEGVHNPQVASDAINRLDQAEADFAKIAENGRVGQAALLEIYRRLEAMLDRMFRTYQSQKDACINTIDNGGTCDYDEPEQLALRALYPLSWLRFEGAMLYKSQPATTRRLLNQAVDGFTDSTLVIVAPELVRENLLGRAFAERELGRFDHSEYAKAITDFKRIMADGPDTRQYRPAQQGLATTYAAMGKLNEARGLTSGLAANATGAERQGLAMLHLRELFRAEAASSEPAQRAELHRQIMEFVRAREGDKNSWAVATAAAAQYVNDPVAEFGGSKDPLEIWFLANVLYYRHRPLDAAKYYWDSARTGKYPKAYRYAADLYYVYGRYDMAEKVADDIARQPANPDTQWALYTRFKIPRVQWERGGMQSQSLEEAWVHGAQHYLARFPRGQYAFEPRFRLGALMQRKGDYLAAAKQYDQVSGTPDYNFTARFNAAECYLAAMGAGQRPAAIDGRMVGSAPEKSTGHDPVDRSRLSEAAISRLRDAIKIEPAAEQRASLSQRKAIQDSRGRAIYMLALMLERQPRIDYREIASILDGYETRYPAMKEHFNQTYEWRVEALDHIGQYAQLQHEAKALVATDGAGPERNDYVKEIGIDFWKNGAAKRSAGNYDGYIEDAKLTATTYEYFARMVSEGKIPAKNLTGTLSVLGQAYLATNDVERAETIFNQVVKADPGSPDANAGLARISQSREKYGAALDLWSRVESVAAESDPLFYEARYNMAEIFARQGNITSACGKLGTTRREHPSLGSIEMKAQWDSLQRKICAGGVES